MEQLISATNLANLISVAAILLLIVYWIHTFVILYHLIRFGVGTRPKQVALVFFAGSFILFLFLILSVLMVLFI